MKNLFFILLCLFPLNTGKEFVTAEDLKQWVFFLSSDEMKGRRNGSPEMKNAAEWISSKFGEYDIQFLDGHDSFIYDYSYNSRSAAINERNVVGQIAGSDPDLRNEIIVISAHFDHVGITKGASADSVNNGADDNAAGTSTLIGIAKYIKESGAKPGRTIVFAAFSGEEDGFRGSRNFVFNLPFAPERIYADMNFEMTGHSEELGKGKYYMTGCPFSNLDDIIKSYITAPGIQLIDTIPITNMLFNSSDNIAFSRISVKDGVATGIPSGTFATSTLARYIHTPSDEAELFDFDNMAVIVNHFADVVLKLSKEQKKIVWTDPKFRRP